MQKYTDELVKNDRIEIGGVHYDVQAKYLLNGVVTLDLFPRPESVIMFNVRLIMPARIGITTIIE